MTPYGRRQTPFTKRMAEDMQVRNLSPRTIDSYTYHVDRYAKHFGKDPAELRPEEVRDFQLWMIKEKKSWSQFNQAVCGLRFFYSVTCKRDWVVKHIPFGHTPKSLPTVLGSEEVARLIACVRVPKHRAVLLTLYAAGLRLTEATNLKIQDIDSARMQLKVVLGKGRKDRYVPLHGATIQICCKLAAAQARLNKHVTPHTLRHSYATGLLEAGVDLMAISRLLGHSSFATTMVYLHCRRQHLGTAPSPIDWLPVRQCPKWVDPTMGPQSGEEPPEEPMGMPVKR